MKNRHLALTAAALFIVPVAAAAAQETVDATASKQLVLDFIEVVFNEAETDRADAFITPEYIQNGSGIPSGIEALQASVAGLHAAFPDIAYTVYQIGAEDDLVAARLVITGTQEGDFMGIPATGRSIQAATINFWRVEDGRLAEHWEVLETYTLLQQLGVIPGGAEGELPPITEPPVTEVVAARASDENRETVEAFFDDLVNEQDLEAANDLIAPDFVWNTPFAPPGRDGFVAFYPAIFEAFPDVQRTPELIVSDNDLVFVLNRITGTHLGGEALYGIPPSGNPIDYQSADIFRLDDGVIVELWDVADYLTLFTQIGLLPPAS